MAPGMEVVGGVGSDEVESDEVGSGGLGSRGVGSGAARCLTLDMAWRLERVRH